MTILFRCFRCFKVRYGSFRTFQRSKCTNTDDMISVDFQGQIGLANVCKEHFAFRVDVKAIANEKLCTQ